MENEEKNLENPVIEINDLHKSYGKKEVLKGLSLSVYKKEVYGFIGKNGAGKSTTIDCIVGLKEQNSGTIKILDYDTKKNPLEAKMHFGYVSSEPTAYEMMSGLEYLEFIAASYDMAEESFLTNLSWLLEKFTLSEADLNRKIKEYSHGMKQKICLMASLIHNPDVWILDEPTVGLDIMVYEVLMNMIKDFAKNGKTVFITSHNIDLVSRVCDRVGIVNNGVIDLELDFNKTPLKRKELGKIFFSMYSSEDNK